MTEYRVVMTITTLVCALAAGSSISPTAQHIISIIFDVVLVIAIVTGVVRLIRVVHPPHRARPASPHLGTTTHHRAERELT